MLWPIAVLDIETYFREESYSVGIEEELVVAFLWSEGFFDGC